MARPIRRYVVKVLEYGYTIRSQGKTAKGGYYTLQATSVNTAGLPKQEKLVALEKALRELPAKDNRERQ